MKRKKLSGLLSVVKKEITKAQKRYKENQRASERAQATSRASWSAAGERVYAQGQVEVSKQRLDSLKKLKKELGRASKASTPKKVVSPCFIKLSPGDRALFFVKNVASVSGFSFVSDVSPLGRELKGKKPKSRYNLKIEGHKTISGTIEEIE